MQHGGFRFDLREVSGALGDLGTLLPLMLGVLAVTGMAPAAVLAGFGLAYCATAVAYRLPIPVQPMKAVAAVLLVTDVSPAAVAASGVIIGALLLLLGLTGWIDRLGRLVPQSVSSGLQLGLGAALALFAAGLMAEAPLIGGLAVAALVALLFFSRLPAALVVIVAAVAIAPLVGGRVAPVVAAETASLLPGIPSWADLEQAFSSLALPQIALTLTNAILLTSLVAGDFYGDRAARVTPRRLSVSTGLMNVLLAPLGALPMCHGAGGVAAHYRMGARTGGAPLMLGVVLLALAVAPAGLRTAVLGAVPPAVLGALLLLAAAQLAWSRRLVDCRPSCRPVIAVTAGAVILLGPFWALLAGTVAEVIRVAVLRRLPLAGRGGG